MDGTVHVSHVHVRDNHGIVHACYGQVHDYHGLVHAYNYLVHEVDGIVHVSHGLIRDNHGIVHACYGLVHEYHGTIHAYNFLIHEEDGKWLASSHPKFLKVMPATGGEPRELHRFKEEYNLERPVTWSADGKYILFSRKKSGQDGWELCRILAEGGEPQKTGLIMKKGFDNLSTHPNGRNIAFSAKGQKNTEFWVMENFLPKEETLNNQK